MLQLVFAFEIPEEVPQVVRVAVDLGAATLRRARLHAYRRRDGRDRRRWRARAFPALQPLRLARAARRVVVRSG